MDTIATTSDAAVHPQANKTDRRYRKAHPNLTAAGFFLPILVVFGVITFIPLVQGVYYSFTNYASFSTTPTFVGWDNYAKCFTDPSLLTGLGFTLVYAIGTTVLIIALSLPLAVILNRKFFGRNFVRSLFFFLSVPSMVVLGLVWQYILAPTNEGIVNLIISAFGVKPVAWLSLPRVAQFCVILIAVWAGVGWYATLFLAYLQAIPADLYEQAEVDGASRFQQFIHITVPQLVPAITTASFLLLSGGLKVYDLPFALTKGGPGYSTMTITQSILVQGVAQGNVGVGSALGVLFFIASSLIMLVQIVAGNIVERRFA